MFTSFRSLTRNINCCICWTNCNIRYKRNTSRACINNTCRSNSLSTCRSNTCKNWITRCCCRKLTSCNSNSCINSCDIYSSTSLSNINCCVCSDTRSRNISECVRSEFSVWSFCTIDWSCTCNSTENRCSRCNSLVNCSSF